MERISSFLAPKPRNANLHSAAHVLADDLCRILNHPKAFPIFLGLARRHSPTKLLAIAREVSESGVPWNARVKLMLWKLGREAEA